jgi:hypothetical protein
MTRYASNSQNGTQVDFEDSRNVLLCVPLRQTRKELNSYKFLNCELRVHDEGRIKSAPTQLGADGDLANGGQCSNQQASNQQDSTMPTVFQFFNGRYSPAGFSGVGHIEGA